MPDVRRVDDRDGEPARDAPEGVCEPAQVHYPRKRRDNWPFRFYEENGRMYQNHAARRKTAPLADAEPALW
jgi:hypothetical protein